MANDFYELRMYRVERGRMDDMQARWHNELAVLFQKHGVKPLGAWQAISGPELPLFVYLMHWSDWDTRETAWHGFYSDPEWVQARTRTNNGSELVEGYTLNFLRGIHPWRADVPPEHLELWLSQVDIGQSMAARNLITRELPQQLAAIDGELVGAMEFITGSNLPQVAVMLSRPDGSNTAALQKRLESAPLGRSTRYQLVAV